MGLLSFLSRKSLPIIEGGANTTFFPMSFVKAFLSDGLTVSDQKVFEYYKTVPELQAVINYRANVLASMKIKMRNITNGEVIEAHPILDLLNNPNPLQGQNEFIKQYSIGKDIFGNGYIHNVFGTKQDKPKALYNIPALNAEIVLVDNNKIPFNQTSAEDIIDYYKFVYNGKGLSYQPDEIIHYNDNQISFKDNNIVKGSSKITALSQACENIKTAYEARGILEGNSPMGILSNQTKDGMGTTIMSPKEKEEIQKEIKKYGLTKEKYQFIVTSAHLGYVSMATNIASLKLFEEVEADQSAIGDAFQFPIELFQNGVTYENKKEAKKQLYQDAIIPEAELLMQGLSKAFLLPEQNKELFADFSHVAVLQDDLEKRSNTWLRAVNALDKAFASEAITIEEYQDNLEKIGML